MAGCLISAVLIRAAALFAALSAAHAVSANPESVRQPVLCQQVFFSDHHRRSLAQDKPLRDLVLSNDYLFVLGQQHVWRFDLGRSALRKFNFTPSSALQNAYLGRDDRTGEVYLATPQMLFEMRSDEPKIKKYLQNSLSAVFDFMISPENYIWITAKGIYLLERQSLKLRHISYIFQPTDQVIISPSLRSFFVLSSDRLVLVDQKLQSKEILRADGLQIKTDNQAVYVQRDEAILRYTFAGELLQTIPVMNSRKLSGMHLISNRHSYMFADGLFEHYQLSNKQVLVGRCAGSVVGNALDVFAGRLAYIRPDSPHMYELRK